MKEGRGEVAGMVIGVLCLLVGWAGYSLFNYTNDQIGPSGVFLLVGLAIGVPVLIIFLLIIGGFVLGVMWIFHRNTITNSESLDSMTVAMGKLSTLARSGGRQPAQLPYNVVDADPPFDPVHLLDAPEGWGTQHELPAFTNRPYAEKLVTKRGDDNERF